MGWILVEYVCEGCEARYESLEQRPAPARTLHVCGCEAERVLSAPKPKVLTVSPTPVSRGKSDPPPSHRSVDTRAIADGQPVAEWRKKRSEMWRNERHAQVKRELG